MFELLTENGLAEFYTLADAAGVRVRVAGDEDQFKYLDEPIVRQRLVNFEDARTTRVTFHLPAIHCIACVWLLENLFRLRPGIGMSQVNFPRKEVAITFENARVKLSEVVALLASLGYPPELKLSDLEAPPRSGTSRQLWLQLGYAGFAFGNLMLFSIATYFGLDAFSGPAFRKLVGGISLALSLPVVTYSALYYWRTAWTTLKQRRLAIEVPIAAGIIAIFAQSTFEVLGARGEGYFDSLCGLIFFLLCGRLFQQKTFDRLSFDRDYKSFFPLSVTRKQETAEGEPQNAAAAIETVSLAQVKVGDRLVIRHGELIPADGRLAEGSGVIDYSFVTGESDPVEKQRGEYLYAGGRQMGGLIEVETVKPVSQSYLTALWNQNSPDKAGSFATQINLFSRRFTTLVIAIAAGAALFWVCRGDITRGFKAFTSVLIVACPCALALASPFGLGTAIRTLGRRNIFVKNAEVIEALARVDCIVFDKTGTLTAAGAGAVTFHGEALPPQARRWIRSVARHSTHPLSVRVAESLNGLDEPDQPVRSFSEKTGSGVEAVVAEHIVRLGSARWAGGDAAAEPAEAGGRGSMVHVSIDGLYRGAFVLTSALRPNAAALIENLSGAYELTLLSGDNARESRLFTSLFGDQSRVQFSQSPLGKYEFVRSRQRQGKTVMMVGDGLNDAGALKQSDVGVAVVESISAFSPASDIILAAGNVARLDAILAFSRRSVRIVKASFILSSLYNVIGISIAAAGLLAPVVCAILMPLSSISVVAFACGMTAYAARKIEQEAARDPAESGGAAPRAIPPLQPATATSK